MISVAVLGAAGRMGQALIRCAARSEIVKVAAALEAPGHEAVGRDAGDVAGLEPLGIAVSSNPDKMAAADVVIDFTTRVALPENVKTAASFRRAMVIGTTGLGDYERECIERAAERVPIVWSPNMCLGVNLLFALAGRAVQVFGTNYRVEIEETHHVHKKDAPSGTALLLAERIADEQKRPLAQCLVTEMGRTGAEHPADKIVIRSFREGEVVGDHVVRFISGEETVEFVHHAWSRDAFAKGALRAVAWVATRRPGLYDMLDVLGFRRA